MNILTQTNIKTMSSLEIAAITNKKHAHVLRDIRSMIEQIGNPKLDYEQYQVVTDSHTQRTSEVKLDKNLTLTLITGYDAGLRYSITKRWDELERGVAQPVIALPDFTNPADAAIAWAAEYKAKEAAQAQVIELQPKADALERIGQSEGSLGIREAAKAAGMKQNEFVAWCIDTDKPISARFMYRDYSGALNAYSHRIEQGLITQKMNSFVGNDGRDRVAPQVRFTPAGIAKIAELIQKSKRKELAIA